MGVVADSEFWKQAINRMWELQAVTGKNMPPGNAVLILDEACRRLSRCVQDPDFREDVRSLFKSHAGVYSASTTERSLSFEKSGLKRFLKEFREAEKAILLHSGVDASAAEDLLRAIDKSEPSLNDIFSPNVERFIKQIEYLQERACQMRDREIDEQVRTKFARVTMGAMKGIGIAGVDMAVASTPMAAFPNVLLTAGASMSIGAAILHKKIAQFW